MGTSKNFEHGSQRGLEITKPFEYLESQNLTVKYCNYAHRTAFQKQIK